MDINDISVVITTLKSEHKIYDCIDSLPKSIKIIIVENSNNIKFKNEVMLKYSNVRCILAGDNKGYAAANNIGLSNVNTKYALVLNPDTKATNKTFNNFFIFVKKFPNFWLVGPSGSRSDVKNLNQEILETEYVKGHAIFFNMIKFNNVFFDDKYFLYLEEIDLCKKIKINKGTIYQDSSIEVLHDGGGSVNARSSHELEKNRNWHWMWSTFYYQKKYKGYILALILITPKLLSSFIKTLLYFLIFNSKKKDIYLCRLSGLLNSILCKKSWKRPTLD